MWGLFHNLHMVDFVSIMECKHTYNAKSFITLQTEVVSWEWSNIFHFIRISGKVLIDRAHVSKEMPTILSGNGLLESQITRILVFSDLALSEYQFFRIFLYRKKYNQNTIFSEFLLLGILFIRAVFNLNTKWQMNL